MRQIGAYRLTKPISSGAFSSVWHCQHITTGETLACKVIDLDNLRVPDFFPHFKNELVIHSHIRHPSITQLFDVSLDADHVYIFLELCDGGDLNDAVYEVGGFSEEVACHYFRQIIGAISYIHALGIAHRDIKLENVLITRDGCAKLTDFGLCKQQNNGDKLITTCGTLIYAAPEIIKEEPYDGLKSDIWSAGIVLYAMVANHFPWASGEDLPPDRLVHETARQIINGEIALPEGISNELENLLSNMLNTDPTARPSAADIMQHPWMELDPSATDEGLMEPDPNVISCVNSLIEQLEQRLNA